MRKRIYLENKDQTNLFVDLQLDNIKPHQHIEERSLRKKDIKDSGRNIKYLKKRAMEYRKEQCGLNGIGGSCIHRWKKCAGDDEYLQEYLDRYIKLKWTCPKFRHEAAPRRNSDKG